MEPVSEMQRYQAEYFMWRAHCKSLGSLNLGFINSNNGFKDRHLGDFPGVNPKGPWLPDDDQYQAKQNTPRASHRDRRAARVDGQLAWETGMAAAESALESMDIGQDRHLHGQNPVIMAHHSVIEATSSQAATAAPPPRIRASSVATSTASVLPTDPERLAPWSKSYSSVFSKST